MQACIFSSPGIEGSKRDEARVEGPGEERRRLPVAAAEHLGDARGHDRTRRVVAKFWQNFGKMLLVFGCIGTNFCK